MNAPLTEDAFDLEPQRWLPRLSRLLEEQRELAIRLDRLSREQSAAVGEGDAQRVLGVLAERQAVVDRLAALNTTLAPFRTASVRAIAKLEDTQRSRLNAVAADAAALIDQVRVRDEGDRATMQQRRDQIADELSQLTRNRGAAAAYGAGALTAPGGRLASAAGVGALAGGSGAARAGGVGPTMHDSKG